MPEQHGPHPRMAVEKDTTAQMTIEAGTRSTSAAAHGKHGHSLIPDAKLRRLYELTLRLHRAGEGANGDGASWFRGREAALGGVSADLRDSDVVLTPNATSIDPMAHRQAAPHTDRHNLQERVIRALSDAVGDRLRRTGRVTALFLDDMQSFPAFREARAMAIAARLPILFVEHATTRPQRGASTRKVKRPSLEYPSIPVDAHDVIALYRVAHESIARARDASGPTHIVCVPWLPAANARRRGTRLATQPASQKALDHLEAWLAAHGMPVETWRQEIVAEFDAGHRDDDTEAQPAPSGLLEEEPTETRAIA